LREARLFAKVINLEGDMKAAVFLDRDGTVNEEVGYINHIDRFRVFPWSAPAVRKLNQAGIPSVLVTNQSGVARGYFPEALVQEIHARLQHELARLDARLDAVYYCPHHPEGKLTAYRKRCDCRKPAPGMLHRAAQDLDLDLSRSFVISDRFQDLSMGFEVGARGILVLSGYGKGEYQYNKDNWSKLPDFVAADLLEGVDWILGQTG
jgi:D-glycero-D-manno-heptose 1,7-bisphosphate phosphatase